MITLHFQSDNWTEIAQQMRQALCLIPSATQIVNIPSFPDNGEDVSEPEPDPVPEAPKPPKATTRKPRSTQSAAPPAPEPAPNPEPEPEPETEPETPAPARDLPSTDVLKAIVTQAVRLAQKKEGPARILELLPEFKIKTGLGFVMEATDAHRDALADLIEAAGLDEATA